MHADRVLVITPQYTPDYGPSAPIYTALCEDLAQMGCDVTVVTAFPNYTGLKSGSNNSGKLIQEEIRNHVRVFRTYIYPVSKRSLWRRLLYHGSFNFFASLAAMRISKPDILIADSPTLWSGLPLLLKAIIPGTPFIYVVHDIYPDVLQRLGVLHNNRMLSIIAGVENYFYKRSIQVSVLSEGFRENLLRKGVADNKITIIPACVDTDFVHPLPKENRLLKEWDLEGKFIVLYAGNIGLSQGLENALHAAKLLQHFPEIVLVLVGDGATKQELLAMAKDLNLANVRFFPFQPREDVPLIYSIADISLVSLKRDIVVESVPSKTYTILASGRPIIATVDQSTEVACLIKESNCGLCIEPENPTELSQAILKLYQDKSTRLEMGRNGRYFVVERFHRSVAAQKYYSIIRQHIKRKNQ